MRVFNPFETFLDVGETKRLSRDEEVTLFRIMNKPLAGPVPIADKEQHIEQMKESDKARDLLARQLIPMVVKFCGRSKDQYNAPDDLIGEGMKILTRCINQWRESYGCRLSTLFVKSLWRDMPRIKANNYLIRIPQKADQAIGILSSNHAELEDGTIPLVHDEEHGLQEEISLQRSILEEAFSKLPEREQLVIKERLKGTPLDTIATKASVTKERIRQLEKQGMKRLQTAVYAVGDARGYPIKAFHLPSVYEVLSL